ncbi:hypothetical protein COB52_00730 [Candidatus Kaiserbacteria bacterium]|nr:MAG: hypothetical protein COB52_00730 [Candidatus Kaiserbacteria bacterium]
MFTIGFQYLVVALIGLKAGQLMSYRLQGYFDKIAECRRIDDMRKMPGIWPRPNKGDLIFVYCIIFYFFSAFAIIGYAVVFELAQWSKWELITPDAGFQFLLLATIYLLAIVAAHPIAIKVEKIT